MNKDRIREKLASRGMKVTPQRMMVMEALLSSREHPTAEQLSEYVRRENPNIATGTIYNILDNFVEKGLINKVKTDREKMRYDAFLEDHHHIYDLESDKIRDLYDEKLSAMIEDYLRENSIPGFNVEQVRLQISGRYTG